ncbi:DNA gyrase inhibitor YacG [Roseateles koreensis]|uniref:DNA gyrase inhibitor YacG n=1 Tax=Roseateles koreensis TaxID=2987526 RepID=A0ABT5KRH0_9BURK|nr:DNA gyrase inhibitor YacG [Roseateles koreensis]MDC8785508.1 DNA gyrase inhibitor YacG [Roseateles koreensis]
MSSTPRIVRCPTCGGDSIFAPSNSWRPFCSQRCRQIDLGAWASESFRVEVSPPLEDQDPDALPQDLPH